MSNDAPGCPEGMVAYSIKQLQHAFRVRMDAALQSVGLSTAQYALLTAISQGAGCSSAELARRCFIKPPSVRELIVRLELDRLIERQSSATHGRVIEVRLTAQGRKLLECGRDSVAPIEADMLRHLTVTERSTLAKLLQRCVEGLSEP